MVPHHKQNKWLTVQFFVNCQTSFGENLLICGNCQELGNWQPSKALRLETHKKIYPKWQNSTHLKIRSNQLIQFKICIISSHFISWQTIYENHCFYTRQNAIQIFVDFNKPYIQVFEKHVIAMDYRQGTANIIQDMQSQWGSSIYHISNYPLQHYHKRRHHIRATNKGSISSNLMSSHNNDQYYSPQFQTFQEQVLLNQLKDKEQCLSKSKRKLSENKYYDKQNGLATIIESLQENIQNGKRNFKSLPKHYCQRIKLMLEKHKQSRKSYPIMQIIINGDENLLKSSKNTTDTNYSFKQCKAIKHQIPRKNSFFSKSSQQADSKQEAAQQELFGLEFF